MALLDRFRAHPGHKHPDAAVRLAFVQELPLEERDLLTEVVREDADPRVRRAAVAKLLVAPTLAGVAKDDADEEVRTHAMAMLRDMALEAFEGVAEPESAASVDALATVPDLKTLALVAKTAPREATAIRALAFVTDSHTLGSLARHAEHESVRRAAFDALHDHAEILNVALNSEFKDPTLAAVDRISDRGELEQIAARARNKSAAKRARALVREMDDREAQAATEAAAEAAAAAAPRPALPDPAELERQALEEAERARETAARQAEEARAREEQEIARRRAAQAAADGARQEAAAALARKEADRCRARLAELADEAARVAQLEDLAAARRVFTVIRKEWHDLHGETIGDADLVARYTTVEEAFTTRDSAAHEADQRARRDALVHLQQLITRIEPLTTRADLSLKAGERALKDLRIVLGAMPQLPLPSKRDYEDMLRRLKALHVALTPKVQELRDVADWQRWANVGIQEQLCEKMEALKRVEDPEEIARHVRDLQAQWRQAADVPRAQGEALWRRFKAAHDEVWARCEAHFAAEAAQRAENLAKKVALCERAEALADSTKWIETADEIKKLQAEWKTIGPVTRGQEKAIWERFRVPCDRFFSRRHADLARRKSAWAENLTKKEALCVKVEAIADSTEWEATANDIKRLQAEWKTIGPVKKSRSEALWQRFRGACDRFFLRYAQRHDITRGERVMARESICAELEALAGAAVASHQPPVTSPESSSDEPPADLVAKVRVLRGRWQQELVARSVDRERAAALDQRFAAAFAGVIKRWPAAFGGTDLDPDANRKRMETLVQRMENLAKSLAGPAGSLDALALSPTDRLAAMLKEALAANTIGGKVDDTSRWRAAEDDVRQAQASWSRIGPVPDEIRRPLADRFQRAIRRIAEGAGRAGVAGGAGRSGGSGGVTGTGRPGGPGR